ncbi:hypothetical protein BC830DRAFT_648183 [Chytriomyces sp. MP71]|nr:hypothetical protein BC830DRAFT_648183 [Chytriomyces sp. MP71]
MGCDTGFCARVHMRASALKLLLNTRAQFADEALIVGGSHSTPESIAIWHDALSAQSDALELSQASVIAAAKQIAAVRNRNANATKKSLFGSIGGARGGSGSASDIGHESKELKQVLIPDEDLDLDPGEELAWNDLGLDDFFPQRRRNLK